MRPSCWQTPPLSHRPRIKRKTPSSCQPMMVVLLTLLLLQSFFFFTGSSLSHQPSPVAPPKCAVLLSNPNDKDDASCRLCQDLAHQLQIPLLHNATFNIPHYLVVVVADKRKMKASSWLLPPKDESSSSSSYALGLSQLVTMTTSSREKRNTPPRLTQPVVVDFVPDPFTTTLINTLLLQTLPRKNKKQNNKKESLSLSTLHIVDATAGWGQDSISFHRQGHSVTMMERNPILYTLLQDGLRRYTQYQQYQQQQNNNTTPSPFLSLVHGDAIHLLSQLEQPVDVVYLDPMFPARKKSSSVKLPMQLLQNLLEDNEQEQEDSMDGLLLQEALRVAQQRVIVKRPAAAPPLRLPNGQVKGSNYRWDIYICNNNAHVALS